MAGLASEASRQRTVWFECRKLQTATDPAREPGRCIPRRVVGMQPPREPFDVHDHHRPLEQRSIHDVEAERSDATLAIASQLAAFW